MVKDQIIDKLCSTKFTINDYYKLFLVNLQDEINYDVTSKIIIQGNMHNNVFYLLQGTKSVQDNLKLKLSYENKKKMIVGLMS